VIYLREWEREREREPERQTATCNKQNCKLFDKFDSRLNKDVRSMDYQGYLPFYFYLDKPEQSDERPKERAGGSGAV